MSEQNWFVYQGNQQLGPFDTAQVKQMLDSKMIAQDAYLFKAGWKDWRPMEDCFEELGLKAPNQQPATPERRSAAQPRRLPAACE